MSSATSARNTPQAAQTTGDTQYNVRDAALRGASSAFSKPPVKPKPQVNTYTGGNNGALLAATKVGTGTPRQTSPIRQNWTGGSSTGRPNPSPIQLASKSSSSSTLDVPVDSFLERTPSPSNIAAKLAAARHSPLKPIPQAAIISMSRERDDDDRDILPPPGSVGNVLARLNSSSPQPLRRRASIGSQSAANTVRETREDTRATDDSPIPPTTSLVKMFEQHRPTTPVKRRLEPAVVSQAPPPVRSPKPQRIVSLPRDIDAFDGTRQQPQGAQPAKPKPKPQRKLTLPAEEPKEHPNFSSLRKDSLGTPPVKQKPAQLTAVKSTPPRSKNSRRASQPRSQDLSHSTSFHNRLSSSLDSNENMSSPSSYASAPEELEEKLKPSLPPPRRSAKARSEDVDRRNFEARPKTAPLPPTSRALNKIASPIHPPEKFPPPRSTPLMGSPSPTDTIYHSNYQRESVKAITKHMTGESLSNAIVGAALASSRNASPAPSMTATPPPLPARRQHHHHHRFHHTRSLSPPKTSGKLRTTLRKEPSSSSSEDESEKYKRKGSRIMGVGRKHPNKHHEGARKRWRDTITERERKRYEGVWAANKGMYIYNSPNAQHPPSPSRTDLDVSDTALLDVVGVVTKEIWARSRLPEHVLEEVWDLVDGRGMGRLRREEFVVGMWLIDQRLKGRKLPLRVSESVWGSVRGVGVKG
ncbi:uncharacterized protein BDR25DRAFT_100840 [Lindgomyces ingoldianus]|uniref:Uncharacterized protein n=1 Tax=Lindgomyces ingoldianus TaxID=673940 RepID=A0ACB6RA44_9PLEO|nr:uncharacterized protein BDR25DRAFT_100840 [Lindgomyces ingoldianus]KAF2475205.1 hypothetical protein BDR25DRAFT_100840 [Lindgomyces ingoldianus]